MLNSSLFIIRSAREFRAKKVTIQDFTPDFTRIQEKEKKAGPLMTLPTMLIVLSSDSGTY
jgi:hypothetical protein